MIVQPGEIIHLIVRRGFEGDLRRHFLGTVTHCEGSLVRLEGNVFVFESNRNEFVRRPELRTRILDIGDAGLIVNVLPVTLSLENLRYEVNARHQLVLTDGAGFELDIHEFGAGR